MSNTEPFYVLRHAETTGQAPDAPLTETGFRSAQALVSYLSPLGIEGVISSPYLRAQQTVEPFCEAAGVPITLDPAAAEWRLAPVDSSQWKSHLSAALDDPNFSSAAGESAEDVLMRAQPLLSLAGNGQKRTLIVSHGGWITLVLRHFGRDMQLDDLLALRNPDLFCVGPVGVERLKLGDMQ